MIIFRILDPKFDLQEEGDDIWLQEPWGPGSESGWYDVSPEHWGQPLFYGYVFRREVEVDALREAGRARGFGGRLRS